MRHLIKCLTVRPVGKQCETALHRLCLSALPPEATISQPYPTVRDWTLFREPRRDAMPHSGIVTTTCYTGAVPSRKQRKTPVKYDKRRYKKVATVSRSCSEDSRIGGAWQPDATGVQRCSCLPPLSSCSGYETRTSPDPSYDPLVQV